MYRATTSSSTPCAAAAVDVVFSTSISTVSREWIDQTSIQGLVRFLFFFSSGEKGLCEIKRNVKRNEMVFVY
jgi:hypothetical protein